ncbi:LPS-assembly lipoprotein [Pseudomonas taetrolens]|uniref:LPS-assembly lipoprotein LptE n=1 Tax=Pseudomonas taetrolens TaxID=47884 RepID=A0A0J6GXY6_PSETA|nr:LPS assembly lipoprotein LptE [Pseudomonas taetrolens]KMM86979.1 lipoprotein [Pseudomonas taetrolens]SEB58584.1 LPS-assembly lipoprotein [Pseudomonas taetrolens]SQF84911.1 lipoprotein, rare lipoprotein B family lipoprotein [Pseudomonas taetrolens]VEH46728.1 lipoprotein, rare lipoprotein B family lipoprotein [Pseudomonas taetrolens]
MIKRNLLVMGLAVLLSACGFQLRGTGTNQLTITELDVSARNAYGDTVRQLRQVLENSGVKVTANAPYKLVLTNEKDSQRAASYAGNGASAEYELTTVLSYQIQGQNHLPLLNDKLEVHKIYLQDGNNITGSGQEAALARKEMRRDLIQQMIARLEQLTPAQLEKLQQAADAKAQAEADAIEAARKTQEETPQQSPLELQDQ